MLNRLLASADNVRLSWARSTDDADRTASPLIAELDAVVDHACPDPGWHAAELVSSRSVEHPDNDKAPALCEGETLAGGAYTVQRQVTNPFSAFAFGRLGINEIQSVAAGLSAKMRGKILHRALHALYVDKPTQLEIRGWINGDSKRRIDEAVETALNKYRWHASSTLRRILEFERQRLCGVLNDFIVTELERSAFEVISVEENLDYQENGAQLKTIRCLSRITSPVCAKAWWINPGTSRTCSLPSTPVQ